MYTRSELFIYTYRLISIATVISILLLLVSQCLNKIYDNVLNMIVLDFRKLYYGHYIVILVNCFIFICYNVLVLPGLRNIHFRIDSLE